MKMEVNHASFILLAQDISDGLDMVAQDWDEEIELHGVYLH